MAEDNVRSFDLKSWQGLTEVLKYARESNLTPEEYGAFRNLVLEYAQQKGTDPALKKKIDDLIISFHRLREVKEEEEDTKKHTHKKKEERMGRRVIPSFMPTFSKVDALEEVPEVPKVVTPPPPETPVSPPVPAPEPVPTPVPPPEVVAQANVLRSIEEYRQRILDVKRRVNSLVGNPIALVDNGNTIGRDYMSALLNALKATSPGSTQNVEEAMERLEATFNRILEYSVRARGGASVSEPSAPQSDVSAEPVRVVGVHPSVTILPSQPEVREETPFPTVAYEPPPIEAYVPPPAPPPTPPTPPYIPPPPPVREEVAEQHIPVQSDPVFTVPIRKISVADVPTPPVVEPEPEPVEVYTPPPAPLPVYEPEPIEAYVPAPPSPPPLVVEMEPEPVYVPEPVAPQQILSESEHPSVEFFAVPPQELPETHTDIPEDVLPPVVHEGIDDAFASRTLGDISENGLGGYVSDASSSHDDVPQSEVTIPEEEVQRALVPDGTGDTRWSESGGDVNLEEQIEELRRQLHETEASGHAPRPKIPSLIDLENALPGGDLREGEGPHAYMALEEEFNARDLTRRPESSLTGITLGTPQAELMSPDVTMALTELLHEWNIFASSGIFGFGPGGIEHPLYVKLSGLPIGEVLAGRFEGVDMKIVHTIKDYVNAWRHEQGIAYNPSETFEHYLRRVSQRILKRQQGLRD